MFFDSHKKRNECSKTSISSRDVIFFDGDIDLTKINDIKTTKYTFYLFLKN